MQGERSLTYAELAAELGISLKAAKERVRRARWPREARNDARAPVRIRVPAEALAGHAPDGPYEAPRETLTVAPSVAPGEAAVVPPGELLSRLAELAEANARLRVEVARLQEQAAAAETLAEERVRAAQAVAIADAATARAEVEGKETVITELRAELARLRRPWWRRLLE